jgi:hypothetical protein
MAQVIRPIAVDYFLRFGNVVVRGAGPLVRTGNCIVFPVIDLGDNVTAGGNCGVQTLLLTLRMKQVFVSPFWMVTLPPAQSPANIAGVAQPAERAPFHPVSGVSLTVCVPAFSVVVVAAPQATLVKGLASTLTVNSVVVSVVGAQTF